MWYFLDISSFILSAGLLEITILSLSLINDDDDDYDDNDDDDDDRVGKLIFTNKND